MAGDSGQPQARNPDATAKMTAPARFGIHWKPDRGKLYRFQRDRVEVIRPWPRPRAWRKTTEHGWRGAFVHCFLAPTLPGAEVRRAGLQHHLERPAWCAVPEEIRAAAVGATLNDGNHQFRVLAMLGHCPASLEVAREVPLLAGALAMSRAFKLHPVRRPWRSIRGLLARGTGWSAWRRAAAWLDLPADKAFVRTLRRARGVAEMDWAADDVVALRRAWAHRKGRRWILHAPAVTPCLVKVVGVAAAHGWIDRVHPDLLAEAVVESEEVALWWRMPSFAATWRRCRPEEAPPMLRSTAQLAALEEALWEAEHRRRTAPIDALPFPGPPLPGDPAGIVPLASPEALVEEGTELHHCIKDPGWIRQARLRQGYGYRVALPQGRATAWVRQEDDGSWAIAEFRGPRNTAPPLELAVAVHAWLARVAPGGPRRWGPLPVPGGAGYELAPGDDIPF